MNTIVRSGSDPLLDGVEGDLVDGGTSVEDSVFFVEVINVPELKDIFLTTGSDVASEGSNSKGVNLFVVGLEGVLEEEVGLPDLESSVPTNGGEVGVLSNRGVSDTRDPILVVAMFIGILTVSKSVPELEGFVSTSRDNLSVVLREADRVDFLSVTNEDSGGLSSSQIPKSKGLIP